MATKTKQSNAELKAIGDRLWEYMKSKNLGLNKLGRMSNTSGAQIHNIINGKKYGIDKMLNISAACPDMDLYYVLTGKRVNQVETEYSPLIMPHLVFISRKLKSKNEKDQQDIRERLDEVILEVVGK